MPWVRDPAFKKMHAGDLFEIGDMAGARKFVADVLADDELGTFSPDGGLANKHRPGTLLWRRREEAFI